MSIMRSQSCAKLYGCLLYTSTAQLQEQAQQLIEQLRTELQGVKDQTGLMLKSVYDADNDGEVDMHGETF